MERSLNNKEVFGFIKPSVDVHTMGVYSMINILRECNFKAIMANEEINSAVEDIRKVNNYSLVKHWIIDNNISILGFSYRLEPQDGCDYFMNLFHQLVADNMLAESGGPIKKIAFAGLPDTCKLINRMIPNDVILFEGDETPLESISKFGFSTHTIPASLIKEDEYDIFLNDFAKQIIQTEQWKKEPPQDHYGYPSCGTENDSFVARFKYAYSRNSLPIIRTHSGPYNPNRFEALKEYNAWCRDLAQSKLLDVLSIGSSQLTQSNFNEDWEGKPNGGGIPVNSELEYSVIKENAKPMLVRTYSGTKNVPELAQIHERALNISWHALSFWWFNELDGRGNNSLLQNLKEHFEAVRYIVTTGKPVEPNVPHHFAFRGADDVTYIVSGYIAAKALKRLGVENMILQIMLNTPKNTWGIQDLAKGRVLIDLVRELEESKFKVYLQTRVGLDYFTPNLETAKIQLAAATCMMDDLEPDNNHSPEVIHVVNYCEAVRLATPPIIKESIQITLNALHSYRLAKQLGRVPDMRYERSVTERYEALMNEAREAISMLEQHIPNLYTPEGFYKVFVEGFLAVPYLMDSKKQYPKATMWKTAFKNGGIYTVDDNGEIISTSSRYQYIIDHMES